MSGEKRVRGFYFVAVFLLLANDVLTEYLFTVERKFGESDIITFRETIDPKSYLESGSFELKNRTWCKQAVIKDKDLKRYTVTKNKEPLLVECLNNNEIKASGMYFDKLSNNICKIN